MMGTWDLGNAGFWVCWMLEIFDVGDVAFLGCGVLLIYHVGDGERSRCVMRNICNFWIAVFHDVRCLLCVIFRMCDVCDVMYFVMR